MDRSEIVRRLILNEISDDYENVDQVILRRVSEIGAKLGLAIERPEIVDALAGLVADGLARAYLLSGREPCCTELIDMPALDIVENDFETYFLITKKGMEFHLSDTMWRPLDDEAE